MKLPLILLIALLFVSQATLGQNIVINENFENVQLAKVLKKLRSEYKLKIAYDNQLVRDVMINQKLENIPLKEALEIILSNTKLTYRFINGKVILLPKPEETIVIDRPISGSNINVSGVIKDRESGETLPNASIRIAGSNKGTISNTDGYFTIIQVPDTSTLIINYLGYQAKKIPLREVSNLSNIGIDLESELKVLDEVTITDQSDVPLEVKERVSKAAFDPRALASLPSLGGQDMFRTLQLMPGVSSTNESSAGLVIRGSIPSQNLVLLDGFTIYHLDHFFGVFSGINADIIKDVQIYKGGFDAKYGGRVAGVVDITGRSGSPNKAKFSVGANLMSVNAAADVPITKKISLLFAFRRAYTDVIQSNLYKKLFAIARDTDEQIKRPVDIPKLEQVEPQFYFYDINSKITFRPSQKDHISLSIYGGKDDLSSDRDTLVSIPANQVSYREGLSERTEWGNDGLSLRWGRQWNEKFYSNLKISGSSFFRNYNFLFDYLFSTPDSIESGNFGFALRNKVEDSNISFDNELIISEKVALEFGFSGMEYNISSKSVVNTQTTDSTNTNGNLGSLYTTAKIDFTE
jgi:ferric enterobactin receptor